MDRLWVPLASLAVAAGRYAFATWIWMHGPTDVAMERGACGYSQRYRCLCACQCGGESYDGPEEYWKTIAGKAWGYCYRCKNSNHYKLPVEMQKRRSKRLLTMKRKRFIAWAVSHTEFPEYSDEDEDEDPEGESK